MTIRVYVVRWVDIVSEVNCGIPDAYEDPGATTIGAYMGTFLVRGVKVDRYASTFNDELCDYIDIPKGCIESRVLLGRVTVDDKYKMGVQP